MLALSSPWESKYGDWVNRLFLCIISKHGGPCLTAKWIEPSTLYHCCCTFLGHCARSSHRRYEYLCAPCAFPDVICSSCLCSADTTLSDPGCSQKAWKGFDDVAERPAVTARFGNGHHSLFVSEALLFALVCSWRQLELLGRMLRLLDSVVLGMAGPGRPMLVALREQPEVRRGPYGIDPHCQHAKVLDQDEDEWEQSFVRLSDGSVMTMQRA